jgi:acyl carrier protein
MDAMLHDQAASRISGIVGRMLEKRGAAKAVSAAHNLREAGLTSLDMVNLMLAVEGEFDIFIPQDQMTPENFRNIEAIHALVAGLVTSH